MSANQRSDVAVACSCDTTVTNGVKGSCGTECQCSGTGHWASNLFFAQLLPTFARHRVQKHKKSENLWKHKLDIHPYPPIHDLPKIYSQSSISEIFNYLIQPPTEKLQRSWFTLFPEWLLKVPIFHKCCTVYYCITFCDYVLFFLWMGVSTSECLATYWGPEFPIFHLVQAKAYDSFAPEDSVSRVSNEDAFLESRLGSSLISTSPRTGHGLGQISQGFLLLRICSSCVWMFAPYKVLHNHI